MNKNVFKRNTAAFSLLMYLIGGTTGAQTFAEENADTFYNIKLEVNNDEINNEEVNENDYVDITEEEKSAKNTYEVGSEIIDSDSEEVIEDQNIETPVTYSDDDIINGDFESQLDGWNIEGDTDAVKISWNNDRNGNVLNYWNSEEYKVKAYQTIGGLENGDYEVSVFVNSYGYNDLHIYAENGDGNTVKKSISPSGSFTKVTLKFKVTGNTVTIGLYGDAAAGAWANFDDIEINKCEEDIEQGEIVNPEFQYNLDGWESTGNTEIISWNGNWGNSNTTGALNYGWYQGEGGYETDTHQTITGIENGTYIVQAYAASSGNQKELYMYAKDFNDSNEIKKEDITDAHNFRITFFEVEVTNNKITIGFHAKGGKEEWANFDSVSLTKKVEDTRESLDAIENYSFSDNLNNWNVKGSKNAVKIGDKGFNDNKSLRYYSKKAYEVRTEQEITNLENGNYKLEFYAKSSGGQDNIYGYVRGSGTSEARTSIPVDNNYRKVVVDFKVTNNKAVIGFYSKAPKNCSSEIDNVKLYKVDEGYEMLKGGDLTELNYVEDSGGVFYDEKGNARDPFHILAENGFNFARLRIYNKTGRDNGHKYEDGTEYYLPDGYQNKEDMLKLAKRASEVGMKIELTLHYSDWWTNGLNHDIPGEWKQAIEGLSEDEAVDKLEELVYEYTKDVMDSMKEQGTIPEFISLGNEMQGGILYPYGRVDNMEVLARFLNAGARAVREVSSSTKIVLHLDEAGDNNRYYKLLDGCEYYNVDYDIIGPSYYPYWTRNSVEQIIPWCNDLYKKYGKKILFMETGYNWNPTLYNSNIVGQLKDNGNESHESTPQGQKEFMDELFNGIRNADDNCIIGDLYWDPIMINNKNVGWAILKGDDEDGSKDTVGDNVVSNTTLFDFSGKALKSLKSYSDNSEGTIYGMISGKVVDGNGRIVTDAEVSININGTVHTKVTDKYGRFFINNVEECNAEITANKEGYPGGTKVVQVNAGQVSNVEVKVSKSSKGHSSSGSGSGSSNVGNSSSSSDKEIIKDGWYKNENNKYSYILGGNKIIGKWIKDGEKWYLLDDKGEMVQGWSFVNDKWYYLSIDGSMHTGWLKDNDKWYYLNESGDMKKGWLNENGKWYYLNDDGSMKTGWIKYNNKWYYLYSSGEMAVDTVIDGYIINKDGEWI